MNVIIPRTIAANEKSLFIIINVYLREELEALRLGPVLEEEEDLADVEVEELRDTVVLLPDEDTVLIVVFEEPEFFTRLLVVVDVLRLVAVGLGVGTLRIPLTEAALRVLVVVISTDALLIWRTSFAL